MGPAYIFRIASTWPAVRQLAVFAPAHCSALSLGSTVGVVHSSGLSTMPSTRPSKAPQASSTAFETSCRSWLVKVLLASGTPLTDSRPIEVARAPNTHPFYTSPVHIHTNIQPPPP